MTSVAVGDILELRYGKALKEADRSGGDVPVVGSGGIVGGHSVGITDAPTIVVGRKGSIGSVTWVDGPAWPIDTAYFVTPRREDIVPRWAYWMLRSLRLETMNKSAAVPGLNRDDVYRLRVPLPPLLEQRRVAGILDQADALRAKRRQALIHLDDLTQSIFVEMFGDPVSNDRGWPICRLSELGTLERGVSKHRPRNDPALLGGTHPLIQTGDVAKSGGYITTYTSTYSDLGLAQSRIWPVGTLCITIAANIARTGILQFEACFPDSVVGFAANPETATYVRVWLGFLQSTLEASAPQSAQKNINLALLRALEVPVPRLELLREFSTRVVALKSLREPMLRAHVAEGDLSSALRVRAFRGDL